MHQGQSSPAADSSSERSSSSAPNTDDAKEGMESDDDDIGRVPEFGLALPGTASTSGRGVHAAGDAAAAAGTSSSPAAQASSGRRRGRSPADKEHRRLKRCVSSVGL
uniref:Uncharacterized protein n=1 Tax=Oryza brachyantha TaxID=4533 RepID=J3MFJ4_ORYBR